MGRKTHGPYLIAAIEYNDITKVSDILSTKFRDKQKVKHFLTSEVRRLASDYTEIPLLLAATLDDPTILKYFVTKHDTNINFIHEYGFQKPKKRRTALLIAVRRGLYLTVDAILTLNGDVNVQDHKGRTPLHHAVRRADYRMAKLLLSRGAQVTLNDASGNSPLHIATIFGHVELVRLLLRQGGDLYKKGQHGAIPIHIAAKEGHASLVRMFCEQYEVNVNIMVPCYDEREKTPLHVAATEGHAETVFSLLEHCKADVNVRDSEGETPLHCVAIHEYDPLGMKSKEDFTETVKVLLNYGAEANARNARGETVLHLAARNEFQKIVEVLVLAGTDPLIEDNDRNKAIDLVAPEDSVSKQTLKNAMADREKYMAEAREVRARGFITNFQNHLPFTQRSQSSLNVPLATMHGMSNHGRLNASHGSAFSSGYLQQNSSNQQIYGGQFRQSSHSRSSSSSSKRKSRESTQSSIQLLPNAANVYNDVKSHQPLYKVRKAKSVEELDQQSSGKFYPKTGSSSNLARIKQASRGRRKNSYQESETTSFWSVTPPGSVREQDSDIESRKSGRKKKPKPTQKFSRDKQLKESDEELDSKPKKSQKKPNVPMKFLPPKDLDEEKSLGGGESDYFLDDDDSFDVLEAPRLSKERKKQEEKALKAMKNRDPQLKPGLSSWLDEQARLLKTKEKPVAHSTPPQQRRTKSNRRNQSDDDDDDESRSEESLTTDSESEEEIPREIVKAKPAPPPKPVKDKVARMGVPVFPMAGGKESLNPRSKQYQRENPDVEQVVHLEVNESFDQGETVIRVIPVNPGGQVKVHKIAPGTSATTFLRLQGEPSGSISSEKVEFTQDRAKGHRKADLGATSDQRTKNPKVPEKPSARMGRDSADSKPSKDYEGEKSKRPVAKPREGKANTPSVEPLESKGRFQQSGLTGNRSSSASSDEVPLTSPSQKGKLPVKSEEKASKSSQNQVATPTPAASSKKHLALVFQKAGAEPDESKLNLSSSSGKQLKNIENSISKESSIASKVDQSSSKHGKTKPTQKENRTAPKSGSSSHQNKSLSDESETSDDEDDDEDTDEDDADGQDESNSSEQLRTVNISSNGDLSYTLVGGNIDGVFVHALDRNSEAAKKELFCGDQILKANDQIILGRTREEALAILRSITGPTSLLVRRSPQKYRAAVKNEGMTDSLFVRAHFSHEPAKRGDLHVHEGDVFCVTDTVPDGNLGSWKVQKMNPKEDEDSNGFIPNRTKADQLTLKQSLTQGKIAPDQRGGTFMRSFRRAKSAERNSRGQDEDEKLLASHGIVSYERVSQKISSSCRPVVVLGLFCDVVINRLAKESPDQFEAITEGIENLKDTKSPVNFNLLHSVMSRGKNPLTILSPPSIEYLQQRTDINPIVIYLSPVSKAVVKALKAKLSPFYNKNTGYMYEEAVRFEKNYTHLFSAVVPYTEDDWWLFHLKEAITRIQKQPIWISVNQKDLEAKIASEMNKILPDPVVRQQPPQQSRASRDRTVRMSRTTDDLPSSPEKSGSTPSQESLLGFDVRAKPILKQPQPSVSSISSIQEQPANTTFHRLHSHNFDEAKSNGKKKTQKTVIQSHETPL